MNKIRLIILANSKQDNFQINYIIKNLEFKNIFLTILYSNDRSYIKKSFFYKILLKLIFVIENKFINLSTSIVIKKNTFINKQKILFDKYAANQLIKKKNYKNLADVIIDLGNHNINRNFLKKIKYGIWNLNYGVADNFYAGFHDCLFNKKITTTYLIKKAFLNNKIITTCIDVSYLNNKINFWLRNRQFIIDKSTNLISKNLNKIFYNLKFNNNKSNLKEKLFEIKFKHLFFYFIKKYLLYFLNKINFFKKRKTSLWSLHIYNYSKNFISNNKINIKKSTKIESPKDAEWADPFIFSYKNKNYVFFENNDLNLNRGKISFGELHGNDLINIKDILKFKYHLSYPFIWKSKNNFYLIPETSEKKSIHIWKAKKFPNQWKYFKTILKNEFCCDTTIIKDKSNNNWLLTNKSNDSSNDPNNELYVYKIIGNFRKLIPHKLNPVITDCRTARNAGKLLIPNKLFRPSQINDSTGYGIGLNINNIDKLNLDSYKERTVKRIFPYKIPNTDGLHHINNSAKHIVFDVRYII